MNVDPITTTSVGGGAISSCLRCVCVVLQETASRMNFPDSPYDAPPPDPTEGPGSDGAQPHTGSTGADVAGDNGWQRFSFQRCTSGTSTATGSSTTTEVCVAAWRPHLGKHTHSAL